MKRTGRTYLGWREKRSEISELYIQMGQRARRDFGIDHVFSVLDG